MEKLKKQSGISWIEMIEISTKVKQEVLATEAKVIEKMFFDFGIKPDYGFEIILSDYPDIMNLPFDNPFYIENLDDMESYFRGNLYYLMHYTKELHSKYKYRKEDNEIESRIFLFVKPIALLSERMAANLNISINDCFGRIFKILLIHQIFSYYFHYLFYNSKRNKLLKEQSGDEQQQLIRTVCQVLTLTVLKQSKGVVEICEKLNKKMFRRLPVKSLNKFTSNELIEAIVKTNDHGEVNIEKLFGTLGVHT